MFELTAQIHMWRFCLLVARNERQFTLTSAGVAVAPPKVWLEWALTRHRIVFKTSSLARADQAKVRESSAGHVRMHMRR